jgi:hypothetical protein
MVDWRPGMDDFWKERHKPFSCRVIEVQVPTYHRRHGAIALDSEQFTSLADSFASDVAGILEGCGEVTIQTMRVAVGDHHEIAWLKLAAGTVDV